MDSPHRGLTARRRFWVAIFALVSLGIMAGGLAYYRYEQDHIRREKYQELAAIADLKVRQILEWRRERIDDARSLTRDPFLGKAIAAWLRDPGNPGLRAALLERLKVEKEGGPYGNVLLADPDGRILLSVRPDPAPLSPSEKQTIEGAIAGRQAVIGDLFRCPKDHRVHLDLAAPVLDNQGRPLAVVVLRTNADEVLYPLIQSWPTPSRTSETFLVEVEGKDVLFLNELRHREKPALSLREPLAQTELPAVQAALGKQGIFEGRDYRGKKVLADLRPVPQSPWFMVAKVDADEILVEARYRAWITTLFAVLFILLTAAVTAYGYRQRQANLYQDLYQTEREQRQAQEEFRTTLYSIGDAVITTDTEGLVKQINPVAERLTGWLEAEAKGKPLEEVFRIINEETRTAVENPALRVLREGMVVGLGNHTLLIARDGTESPIADSGAPIRDESGAVNGVVLVFRDQTEDRAAQKALRESEEHYRSLFDNMLNGFAYCKMLFEQNQPQDFIYLNVNSSFEILTGLKNVVGKRVSEVIPGIRESNPELFEIYGRVALTGKPERFETYVEALKAWFSISVYSPEKEYFVAVFDVITERKRAEEALRASEERYRMVADYTYDMEYWINEEGKVLYMSLSCERFTGYPAQAFIDDPHLLNHIVHPQDIELFKRHGKEAYSGAGNLSLDFRLIHRNGQEFWVSHSCQPVFGIDGRYLGRRGSNRDITERKRAEEALRESEEKYRLLVNQIPAVVFKGYGDWSVDFFDNKIEILCGYTKEEFDSRKIKWCDLILPEDLNKARYTFIDALKTNKSYHREYRIRRKDGASRWIQAIGQIFTDATGKVEYVSGVFFDITEHKAAEEALWDHLFFMQTLLDTIPSPIFYKNLQGIYLGCNQALSDFLGMPKEEIIGKSVYDVYPKDLADKYFEMDAALFRNPGVQIYDFSMRHADGTIHGVNFNKATYCTADGTLAGLVGVMIDITDRKRAEEALQESEEKYRLVFEKAPLGIMHYDQTSTITDCNEKFAEIIGAPKEKFIGFNMIRQLRDDKMREAVAASRKGEVGYYEGDYFSVTAGKLTPVRAIYQPIFSSDGVLSGGVTIFEDISERKRAELERLQFSKLESLGTLAGGIAHDFNNILTAILGNISLARLDPQNEEYFKERLNDTERACQKAQMLAQQLLTFAKGGAPVKELVSVENLVTETGSFTCRGSKAQFTFSFSDNLWAVEADAGQLTQVIQNLIINAIQAMPTGGIIKVQAENLVVEATSDLPLGAGKYVKISIKDQGVGIPADHLARIFDPYFTTKQTGSGLGLATAHSVVHSHHGHISVDSTLGKGTTFNIYLPAVAHQRVEPPDKKGEVLTGQGKILVMDDEEMVRQTLDKMLHHLGYRVMLARDGAEAIELFSLAQESGQPFDAVILDLTVPGGMGGKETLEKLLRIDPRGKTIVSSGYSDDPIMAEFAKYGFSGVIAKPYRISELSKLLHKVLSKGK